MRSLLLFVAVFLAGCEARQERINYPQLPDELKDCSFFYINNGQRDMQVVRCPNSTTSTGYRSGKTSKITVVIDGVTYEKKDAP